MKPPLPRVTAEALRNFYHRTGIPMPKKTAQEIEASLRVSSDEKRGTTSSSRED